MIRKGLQRRELPGTARFLTCSCFHRYPLFGPDPIKAAFVERLDAVSVAQGVAVLAWVVMPNHVHLVVVVVVVVAESTTADRYLHGLKGPFSQFVLRRWRALDAPVLASLRTADGHRFWQAGGGYDRNVVGDELREKIAYCHANPIKRGLVDRSTDWPWSSARRYAGRDDAIGPAIRFDLVPRGANALT